MRVLIRSKAIERSLFADLNDYSMIDCTVLSRINAFVSVHVAHVSLHFMGHSEAKYVARDQERTCRRSPEHTHSHTVWIRH